MQKSNIKKQTLIFNLFYFSFFYFI